MAPEIKNPIFIKNVTDPENGKMVKSVWEIKKSKIGRTIRTMIWQYYRDRARNSIEKLYKQSKQKDLEIIYFDDPKSYFRYKIPQMPKGDKTSSDAKVETSESESLTDNNGSCCDSSAQDASSLKPKTESESDTTSE